MNSDNNELTSAFVEQQRERLEKLRDQFLNNATEAEAEERELSQHHHGEVQDSGDAGAIEAQRETVDIFSVKNTTRLHEIQRTLEKLEEGTYGLSDDSGEPIARARLEAVPEARFTVEEEALRESRPGL